VNVSLRSIHSSREARRMRRHYHAAVQTRTEAMERKSGLGLWVKASGLPLEKQEGEPSGYGGKEGGYTAQGPGIRGEKKHSSKEKAVNCLEKNFGKRGEGKKWGHFLKASGSGEGRI